MLGHNEIREPSTQDELAVEIDDETYDRVAHRLRSLIADIKRIPVESIADIDENDDFLRQLDMDSIDAVELTLQLDREFEIGFGQEPDDLDCLASFGSLLELVLIRGSLDNVPPSR